jgi:hypothetical protein
LGHLLILFSILLSSSACSSCRHSAGTSEATAAGGTLPGAMGEQDRRTDLSERGIAAEQEVEPMEILLAEQGSSYFLPR